MAAKRASKSSRAVDTFGLDLTSVELEMLRDAFGVVMPISSGEGGLVEACVTKQLATLTDRESVEQRLWHKIARACAKAGVIVGDEAPTFAVSAESVPSMYVYKFGVEENG